MMLKKSVSFVMLMFCCLYLFIPVSASIEKNIPVFTYEEFVNIDYNSLPFEFFVQSNENQKTPTYIDRWTKVGDKKSLGKSVYLGDHPLITRDKRSGVWVSSSNIAGSFSATYKNVGISVNYGQTNSGNYYAANKNYWSKLGIYADVYSQQYSVRRESITGYYIHTRTEYVGSMENKYYAMRIVN
ncbi:MAG: hypothetical protein ACRDCN_14690 [Tannerellaceae bacterium]|uniref:hypothetical protein n=1 Tax=Serratia sp. (in: enterobacteria) TaxID=616 RepID=UPI003EE458EB